MVAYVGAGGEIKILPRAVECRVQRVTHPVGYLVGLARVERVNEDRAQVILQLFRICDPAAVRRPRRGHEDERVLVSVCINLYRGSFFDLHVPYIEPLVAVSYLTTVGRPDGRIIKRWRVAEVDLFNFAHPRLVTQVQSVFARFVREVCYPFSVGRPCRIALHHAGCAGQVADVSLLAWDREDFAARLEHGPRACRREAVVADKIGDMLKSRPHRWQVGCDVDIEFFWIARIQIKQVERTELLIDNRPRPCRSGLDIKSSVANDRGDFLALDVVSEQAHRPVAVRKEIYLSSDPHRVEVVRVVARDFFDSRICQIGKPYLRRATAAITLPLSERARERLVGHPRAVR